MPAPTDAIAAPAGHRCHGLRHGPRRPGGRFMALRRRAERSSQRSSAESIPGAVRTPPATCSGVMVLARSVPITGKVNPRGWGRPSGSSP